jgi:hypothetical protein
MPQNRNRLPPAPHVMTWSKASPVLIVAVLFDILRAFFQMFWFFGPALAAFYCANTAGGWIGSLWGLTTAVCAGAAAIAGSLLVEATAPIGVIMADAVGLIAFLALGLWVIISNARLFKTAMAAPAYFVGAFAFGEIPFIGALPVFTLVLWRLYRTQIRVEREAYRKWKETYAAAQLKERQEQAARLMQMHAAQETEMQEAANDEAYAEQEAIAQTDAANDDRYGEIPEGVRRAA